MRKLLAAAAAVLALLALPSSASAGNITLGPDLKESYPVTVTFLYPGVTLVEKASADPGVQLVSPVDGVIVRWRLSKQPAADPYALRVLRPAGTAYTGAGASTTVFGSTSVPQTFTTHLPIRAGDMIGLDLAKTSNPTVSAASASGLAQPFISPVLADGATAPPSSVVTGVEFGFNAEIWPAPRVVLVGPSSGPTAGGTTVTIAGSDFRSVSDVRFGSTPATSYEVVSEAEIKATAPAQAAGTVDVSVTTGAGASPAVAGDRFTYEAPPSPAPAPPATPPVPSCVVPKLAGKKLKAARKALAGAHCSLGKVRGEKGNGAKVVKQAPKPGVTRVAGSSVWVKLG